MINIQDDINKVVNYAKSLGCEVKFSACEFYNGSFYPFCSLIIINSKSSKEKQLIALLHELGHYIDFEFENFSVTTLEAEFQAWYHAGQLLRLLFNGMYSYFFEKYYTEWLGSYLKYPGKWSRGQVRILPSKLDIKR